MTNFRAFKCRRCYDNNIIIHDIVGDRGLTVARGDVVMRAGEVQCLYHPFAPAAHARDEPLAPSIFVLKKESSF